MSVIEIGGLAGALIAVLTLISKIINLITSIQSLVNRLERMQDEFSHYKENQESLSSRLNDQERRIHTVELMMQDIHGDVVEIKGDVKEMLKVVFK